MPRVAADTRDRILDCATELFSQEGYSATRVHNIAKSCGISQALIYYNFTSKEEILSEIFERFKIRITKMFVEVFSTNAAESESRSKWSQEELEQGISVFTEHQREFAIMIFESMKKNSVVPNIYEFWDEINRTVRKQILVSRGYVLDEKNRQHVLVDIFFILIPTMFFSTIGREWAQWRKTTGSDTSEISYLNTFTEVLNGLYETFLKDSH